LTYTIFLGYPICLSIQKYNQKKTLRVGEHDYFGGHSRQSNKNAINEGIGGDNNVFCFIPREEQMSWTQGMGVFVGFMEAIRFSTLEAICKALDCQPGDLLEYTGG